MCIISIIHLYTLYNCLEKADHSIFWSAQYWKKHKYLSRKWRNDMLMRALPQDRIIELIRVINWLEHPLTLDQTVILLLYNKEFRIITASNCAHQTLQVVLIRFWSVKVKLSGLLIDVMEAKLDRLFRDEKITLIRRKTQIISDWLLCYKATQI